MREFIVIISVLLLLGALMALVTRTAAVFNMGFLVPFLYSIPFAFMAYGSLKDARCLEKLNDGQRVACKIRAFGFLAVTIPFFLKDILPFFYLYSAGIFVLNIVVSGILEDKAAK